MSGRGGNSASSVDRSGACAPEGDAIERESYTFLPRPAPSPSQPFPPRLRNQPSSRLATARGRSARRTGRVSARNAALSPDGGERYFRALDLPISTRRLLLQSRIPEKAGQGKAPGSSHEGVKAWRISSRRTMRRRSSPLSG